MKIFHVIDSAGIYGAEVMLLNLMEEQQKIGLIPILGNICSLDVDKSPLEIEAHKRGLKVIQISLTRGYTITGSQKIMRIARNEKIDLFHSHGYKGDILLGCIPRKFREIPIVRTLHGWTSTKKISKIWLYELLDRFCMRNLDAIIQVYEDSYFSRRANIPKGSNSFVIENGIPRLNFNGVSNLQKDFESNAFFENAFIVGGIGRLSKEKGFNYLIEAMSHLLNHYDYRLVIIGEGNQKSQLEKLINQKGLINRVHLYGYRQNAFKYLPLFDVFVLPSLTEGLPIILLEAMQAETPIVATRVGGVPEVLGNGQNGVLVEPGNPVALTKAILNLRNNQGVTREKARKAKEVALAKYSSARMAGDYLQVYEGVLRNRPIREENI
jgi:glycosyltransferase involved in cell wall biosynthesis